MKINKLINKNKGFTLVELIVSLGLFTVVMMISTSALLSLSATNEKVQSMRTAFDNLNLVMESMSRELRMGIKYHCDASSSPVTDVRDCPLGATSISFLSQKGKQITYQLDSSAKRIERRIGTTGSFDSMTSPEVMITNLKFYVLNSALSVKGQPTVLITISGTAGNRVTSDFNIQTMVTMRMPK